MIKKIVMTLGFMVFVHGTPVTAQVPGSMTAPSDEELTTTEEEIVFDGTDPCPEPRAALGNTPNDLKKIQEDITRFNLCLQRAQLLNRLNDLASDNIDTINTTLDDKLMAAVGNIEMPELPPMQVAAPERPHSANMASNNAPSTAPAPFVMQEDDTVFAADWTVRDITGRGNDLVAVLVDDMENLVRVRRGEKLPESDIMVVRVTSTGVSVKDKGEVSQLSWAN